jgi:membrane-associated phospholipid phosphatase
MNDSSQLLRSRTPIDRSPLTEASAQFRLTRLLWLAGISLLFIPIATLLDVPVARWFAGDPLSREVSDALNLSLVYAHGSGVFLILVSIVLLAPERRWQVPRLATLALGAGAVATLAKLFILRPRPNSSYVHLDSPNQESAWAWSFDWTLSQVAQFDASTRAFPSANVATATALTVGLLVVLPRGRWLFFTLCAGTMMQRLNSGGHFLSDLFGSAAVGLAWAYICHHPALMGSVFDKMEPEKVQRRPVLVNEENAVRDATDDSDTVDTDDVNKRAA